MCLNLTNQSPSWAIASNEALQLSFKTKQPTFLVATVEVLLRSWSLGLAVVETASEVALAVGVRVAVTAPLQALVRRRAAVAKLLHPAVS